jgi:glycosyltransferase involved in cell wall biosynthesis
MRIVILTGIWPPDVGGPATHGPDIARFLRDRGHRIDVVTMADREPSEQPVAVHWIRRGLPFPVRYSLVAERASRLARRADVIYATATYAAAAAAATASRTPLVAKLVSDPAYERAWRYGLFRGTLEEFQGAGGARLVALRKLRTASLRRAERVFAPSGYLAHIADGWGLRRPVDVLVNPAPPPSDVAPELLAPGTFVFVGRLTSQKGLPVALAALAEVPDARLLLVGDGPERGALELLAHDLRLEDRVTFAGSRPRDAVLRALAGARAALLPSTWENLPHAAVEALSVGTPVVASAVGGVPEVVHDGENGLLVPAGDPAALATALRRMLAPDGLRDRLAAAAKPSVEAIGRDAIYARLEAMLAEAAAA